MYSYVEKVSNSFIFVKNAFSKARGAVVMKALLKLTELQLPMLNHVVVYIK
jgi:hypothetical protein